MIIVRTELYQEEADGTITLEETLLAILDPLGDRDDWLCHSRYVCMVIILALAVESTVKVYLPEERKIVECVPDASSNEFSQKCRMAKRQRINSLSYRESRLKTDCWLLVIT